jgi:hypothetical protein
MIASSGKFEPEASVPRSLTSQSRPIPYRTSESTGMARGTLPYLPSPELDAAEPDEPAPAELAEPEDAAPLALELLPDWLAGAALASLSKQSFGIDEREVYLLESQRGSIAGAGAGDVVAGCEETAGSVVAFFLARSPMAIADVLATAKSAVTISAGAVLRIWTSRSFGVEWTSSTNPEAPAIAMPALEPR